MYAICSVGRNLPSRRVEFFDKFECSSILIGSAARITTRGKKYNFYVNKTI